MKCLNCGSDLKYIKKSKKEGKEGRHNVTRKRYKCENCGEEFNTTERVTPSPTIIITNEIGYSVFSKSKYQNSLLEVMQDKKNAMSIVKSIILAWYIYAEKTRDEKYNAEEGYEYLDYEFTIDELIEFTCNELFKRKLYEVASRYLALCFFSVEDEVLYEDLRSRANTP